jgi:uncharacterized coiled-coil protein SlyX
MARVPKEVEALDRRIDDAERNLTRQRQMVDRLSEAGANTKQAKAVLAVMRGSLRQLYNSEAILRAYPLRLTGFRHASTSPPRATRHSARARST